MGSPFLRKFTRVSAERLCPVCGHADWCVVDHPTSPARVICPRVESKRRCGQAGWLHVLGGSPPTRPSTSSDTFADAAAEFQAAVSVEGIERAAQCLASTPEAICRLGIGWARQSALERWATRCRGSGCWAYPLRDAGDTVVGVHLVTPGGAHYCLKGSRQGLFLPDGLEHPDLLLLPVGPYQTASLLGAGFNAVGRPDSPAQLRVVPPLIRRLQPREVVLVVDHDHNQLGVDVQHESAKTLAAIVSSHVQGVRVMRPPQAHGNVLAWRQAGASRSEIEDAIREGAAHGQPSRSVDRITM